MNDLLWVCLYILAGLATCIGILWINERRGDPGPPDTLELVTFWTLTTALWWLAILIKIGSWALKRTQAT